MSHIRILPEILSNKIAAGEVVERPASVVKELVENALDADSTRVTIEVNSGGKSLIRVSDDGCGMGRDDALLSIERYATSKIREDADLFAIRTLGFRGEALPSIAAVSRFELVTRGAGEDAATRIAIDGGKIRKVDETGAPTGTMITVRQLFFNTPARRKFLKTTTTEMGHVADTVARMAMGRPGVRFKLIHNDRTVKDWPATRDPAVRVADVMGIGNPADLCAVNAEAEPVIVSGWLLSGRHSRSTSRSIYAYVNGRFVRDRVIQHAVMDGFRGRLMKGQFPVAAIFVAVPVEQVDVNVHPTKHEVRFAEQRRVHDIIRDAVTEALRETDRRQWTYAEMPASTVHRPPQVAEAPKPYATGGGRSQRAASRDAADALPPADGKDAAPAPTSKPDHRSDAKAEQTAVWADRRFADMRIIGQVQDTYILCESTNGLVLIDHHAAHERVLFEKLKKSVGSESTGQRLLMPETVELGYREAAAMERLMPALQSLGFEVEPFGGNTFIVSVVPALVAGSEIAPVIRTLAEKTAEGGIPEDPAQTITPVIELMACHRALRAHQRLTDAHMRALLRDLDQCDTPSHCPHGRPTFITWSQRDLQKAFKRIV